MNAPVDPRTLGRSRSKYARTIVKANREEKLRQLAAGVRRFDARISHRDPRVDAALSALFVVMLVIAARSYGG